MRTFFLRALALALLGLTLAGCSWISLGPDTGAPAPTAVPAATSYTAENRDGANVLVIDNVLYTAQGFALTLATSYDVYRDTTNTLYIMISGTRYDLERYTPAAPNAQPQPTAAPSAPTTAPAAPVAPTAAPIAPQFVTAQSNAASVVVVRINDTDFVPASSLVLEINTKYEVLYLDGGPMLVVDGTMHPLREAPAIAPTVAVPASANGTIDMSAQAPVNNEGYYGLTTAEAQALIGLNVQRLRSEPAAWVFRVPEDTFDTAAICPPEFVCTLHRLPHIGVYQGDGTRYTDLKAGTFRYRPGYPATDAVRQSPPLLLLEKEQRFGANEIPSFEVVAGNFDVTANAASLSGNDTNNQCGVNPADAATVDQAACLLFGPDLGPSMAKYVSIKPDTNGSGFYYSGPEATFQFPGIGRLDGDGWQLDQTSPAGQTYTGTVATWWRDA